MLSSILCSLMMRRVGITERVLTTSYGPQTREYLAHLQFLGLAHSWVRTSRYQEVEKFWGARNLQIHNHKK